MPIKLRPRGTANAYPGGFLGRNTRPKFSPEDSTWTSVPGGFAKNVLSGNTLHQNLVTYDDGGVPRRVVREIYNYSTPEQADTVYVDGRGESRPKNPTLFQKPHSTGFMQRVDTSLNGMEPNVLNEKEIKASMNGKYFK